MTAEAHEVVVLCDCGDIEQCRMELYVSDIRILLERLDEQGVTLWAWESGATRGR